MASGADVKLQRFSDTELAEKKKALTGLLVVLMIIEGLYLAYYAYLFVNGSFDADRHVLGLVPLLGINVVLALNVMNISKLTQEQRRREGG
ncbi:MAG: hypothetical protein AAGB27_10320 [Pseudomonadota bacterium]